ncbi:hypothetical protein [Actinoallomurus acanthiterrae]
MGTHKNTAHGIADNTIYATEGTQIIFTVTSPWIPVFEVNDDVKIALSLHHEKHDGINQSTEYCCTVNDQIVEPHHRMRLNEGDLMIRGYLHGALCTAIHHLRT